MADSYSSMDYWFSSVVNGDRDPYLIDGMYRALRDELPRILSVVAERTCNLQCEHCIFQFEKSRNAESQQDSLGLAVQTILRQMRPKPLVVYEGRIFQPSHLAWLKNLRAERPDCRIGIIDNGSYIRHDGELRAADFKFDWIDISVDGTEQVHNRQRRSAASFQDAINGIKCAHRHLRPGGKVSSLYTLTSLNCDSIGETAALLPPEVSEWHITTLSPVRPEIAHLKTSDDQFDMAWHQMLTAHLVHPLILRIYVADDMLKLAKAVGGKAFMSSLKRASVDLASLSFTLDSIPVVYYPQSVSPSETFVLDSDGCYRVPYSLAFTLKELRDGISRFGDDTGAYTVRRVDATSDFQALYRECVSKWQAVFGRDAIRKETDIFDQIRELR